MSQGASKKFSLASLALLPVNGPNLSIASLFKLAALHLVMNEFLVGVILVGKPLLTSTRGLFLLYLALRYKLFFSP